VAIHRNGGHMLGKIGDVVLQGGDVLLLDTLGSFVHKYRTGQVRCLTPPDPLLTPSLPPLDPLLTPFNLSTCS
jgi:hypothetical protein